MESGVRGFHVRILVVGDTDTYVSIRSILNFIPGYRFFHSPIDGNDTIPAPLRMRSTIREAFLQGRRISFSQKKPTEAKEH